MTNRAPWTVVDANTHLLGGGPFAGSRTISVLPGVKSGAIGTYAPPIYGDCTVEFWYYYPASRADWQGVFGSWTPANTTVGYISFMVGATYTICSAGGTEIFHSGTARYADGLSVGWHHIAIVRSGTAWTVYIDGVGTLFSSTADNNAISLYNAGYLIDSDSTYNSLWRWVSDLRVSKMARYTANFTPPTAPFDLATDPNASSVVSQLDFKQINDPFDATYRSLWTVNGNVLLDPVVKKFGANSLLFDGSTSYVSTYPSPDLNLSSTTSWTIDFWIMAKNPMSGAFFSYPDHNTTGNWLPISIGMSTNGDISTYPATGYVLGAGWYNGTGWTFLKDGTTALTQNVWSHIELGYDSTSGNAYFFKDGVLIASGAWTQLGMDFADSNPITLGRGWASTPRYLNGWIDEFCFLKGVCKHTANFTPPTAAYDPATDPNASSMIVLLHADTLPQGGRPQLLDLMDVWGGGALNCIDMNDELPTIYNTSKSWSSTTGNLNGDSVADTVIGWSNARYIQDTADTRVSPAYLIDPQAYEGFIHGICVVQGNPLDGCVLELSRNDDFTPIARTGTGADGLYQFDNLQLDVKSGFYAITARPDPLILNENAQIYKMVDATDYRISTTGAFTYATGTTTVDSTVQIVGNAAPFTVTVASGTLPPGAVVSVSGRNISITGATSIPQDYAFTLSITGSVRSYNALVEFNLTATGTTGLGSTVASDGSFAFMNKTPALMISMSMTDITQPTTWTSDIKGLVDFGSLNSPSKSTTQFKVGDASLALNGSNQNLYSTSNITIPPDVFTMEAWIYIKAMKNYNVFFDGRTHTGFQMSVNASGNAYFWNGSVSCVSTSVLAINTWYHVAFTRNESNIITCWLNGVSDNTADFTGLPNNVNGTVTNVNIGCSSTGGNYFNGYINNVKVWNTCQYYGTFTPDTTVFKPNMLLPAYP